MALALEYFEKWFRARRRPLGSITELEARSRYESGSAFVGYDAKSRVVIDCADPWISIAFLDDRLRYSEQYDFRKDHWTRAYCSKVMHVEYVGDSNDVLRSTVYAFGPEGECILEIRSGTDSEERGFPVDSASNWIPVPAFDDMQKLSSVLSELREKYPKVIRPVASSKRNENTLS